METDEQDGSNAKKLEKIEDRVKVEVKRVIQQQPHGIIDEKELKETIARMQEVADFIEDHQQLEEEQESLQSQQKEQKSEESEQRAETTEHEGECKDKGGRRSRKYGKGKRTKKHKKEISVFYANATSHSDKAIEFFQKQEHDLLFFAETHAENQTELDMARRMKVHVKEDEHGRQTSKRKVKIARPAKSENSEHGNYGGVMSAVKTHLRTSVVITEQEERTPEGNWLSNFRDIVAETVHVKDGDIIIIGAYARNGETTRLLRDVSTITWSGRLPFCSL